MSGSLSVYKYKRSYPIRKLNQIALIFSDRIFITVADDRELLPNRCHDNSLITVFGVSTPFLRSFFSGTLLRCPKSASLSLAYFDRCAIIPLLLLPLAALRESFPLAP